MPMKKTETAKVECCDTEDRSVVVTIVATYSLDENTTVDDIREQVEEALTAIRYYASLDSATAAIPALPAKTIDLDL